MRKTLLGVAALLFMPAAMADWQVVTESDAGKTIEVPVQYCVEVRLSQNASTGYSWAYDPALTKKMDVEAPKTIAPKNAPPGAPSKISWVMCPKKTGTVAVQMAYRRPWEKTKPPAKTLQFKLNVVD